MAASGAGGEVASEDKIIRFRLGDDLGLPVSHITFPVGKKQSVMMWKHQIVRKLNDKYKSGLDPNNCSLADSSGQAFGDAQHPSGAELKDAILHKGEGNTPLPSCSCGAPHTHEEIFCPECGEKLKVAAPVAAVAFENPEIEALQLQMETAMKEKESLKHRLQTAERWGGEDKVELDRLLEESRQKIDGLVNRLITAKNALADEMAGPVPVKKVEEAPKEEKKLSKAEIEQQKKAAAAEKENDKRIAEQKALEKKETERKEKERKDLEKKQAAEKAAALKNSKYSSAPRPITSPPSSPPFVASPSPSSAPEAPEPPFAPDPPSAPDAPSAPGPPAAPPAPAGPVGGGGYGRPAGAPANRGNLLDQIAAGKKLKKAVTVEKTGDVVGSVAGASKAKPAAKAVVAAKPDPKAAAKAAEQAKKDKALAEKNEAARKKEAEQKAAAEKAAALRNPKSRTQPAIPTPASAPPAAPEAPPDAPEAPPDAPSAPPDAPGGPPDAPGAPSGVPDPPSRAQGYGRPAAGAPRGALLDQIAAGKKLKKVATVEKTGDQVGNVAGKGGAGGGSRGTGGPGGGSAARAASPKPAPDGPLGDIGAIAAAKFAARQAKGAPIDPIKDRPKVAAINEGLPKVTLRKAGEDDGKSKPVQKPAPAPAKPAPAPVPAKPAPAPAPAKPFSTNNKVATCPKCGKPKGSGRFCEDCGAKY